MRVYELTIVFRSSLSEAARKKLLDTIKSWLKDIRIAKEDQWGLRALAYKIKKDTNGYYSFLTLESKTSIPLDFEKKLMEQEEVLRHLLLRRK